MDYNSPGSCVRGVLQARILEWVASPSSRGSSQPRDRTRVSALQADSLLSEPPGKPLWEVEVGNKELEHAVAGGSVKQEQIFSHAQRSRFWKLAAVFGQHTASRIQPRV